MKNTIRPLLVGSIVTSALQCINAANNSQRPNILLVLMDDLGYSDVGFMPGASPDIFTPNIDAAAQNGTIFKSAYVTHPFSGPSRASIMTGRMPHSIGAQFNLASFSNKGVEASEKFISSVLKDAGYYTGVVGKWHLGEGGIYHPNNRGFDFFFGFLGGGHEYFSDTWLNNSTYNPSNYAEGNYPGDYNRPMMMNSTYVESAKSLYCTDVLTDAAINFFDNAAMDTKPFFLYMSYNAPHTPVQAKTTDIATLRTILGTNAAANGSERLTYTAMMYNVDLNFKRLIDKLKSTGKYDNTLIVFLSDNGGKTTAGALNNPLKGAKGDVFEGGFRVPMFIHWPAGQVPSNYLNNFNFSSLDFYPTFAHLAGATIAPSKKLDGINVWSNIINKTDPRKDIPIFVMRPHNGFNNTGVVKNNYKLYSSGNNTWLLYNLTTDIAETTNIAASNPTIVAAMKEAAYRWSWSHIRPYFFDAPSYGFETNWNTNNMPNYAKTFGSLFNSADYLINTALYNIPYKANHYNITLAAGSSKIRIETGSTINSSVDAALYNIHGKLVQIEVNLTKANHDIYNFEVDRNLPNGMYIASLRVGANNISKQLVIAR